MSDSTLEPPENEVAVLPTKTLFVDMLTRDLQLDRAVLDLVDNSVDGARRLRAGPDSNLSGLNVDISVSTETFEITDNCGGIGIEVARHYAFRIGRSKSAPRTPNSVGQFGVGMKRALFKFGHIFEVSSATAQDRFSLKVDVDAWENDETNWNFRFTEVEAGLENPVEHTGTKVLVTRLRQNVAQNFGLQTFQNSLRREIARTQQQYIDRGLTIKFNGVTCLSSPWTLLQGSGLESFYLEDGYQIDETMIHVRIFAGISTPSPVEAGWYIFCNGRLVLKADQTNITGWGKIAEDEVKFAPKYHNVFARFRGFVFFDSEDAGLLPWNTTKTGVDEDAAIYQAALLKMIEGMRAVLEFLRRFDDEKDASEQDRPLTAAVGHAIAVKIREISRRGDFAHPERAERRGPPPTSIQFKRPREQVEALQEALNARSARETGELAFDFAFRKHCGGSSNG